VTVSSAGAADWTATDVRTTTAGEQSLVIHGPGGVLVRTTLPIPGTFNVTNAVLAAACLHAIGTPTEAIAAGLATVEVPGRMERVALGQDFAAVVDYSHKPAAVAFALDAVRASTSGRVIVVLGCGGDRDVAKRPLMGQAAARRSDLLIVTDDNPRSEDPAEIRAAMLAGAREVPAGQRGDVIDIGDRRAAIGAAVDRAARGDVVVVAGKGHESGQEIAGVMHPFSDRDELAAAIRRRLEVRG
jgi:UDP-N-acetylmuramoyl-L-alanyl-D-glutamate--2,6-diaminopimelate ligase